MSGSLRVVVAFVLFLGGAHTLAPPVARAASTSLRVGSVSLTRCSLGTSRTAWCGSYAVPLDPTDRRAGTIRIGFGWLPALGPVRGTVVAQEGGPGYPSTGTAPDFEAMLGPVLRSRNLLVVDARGTGRSAPIDCEPLQSLPPHSPRFAASVAACGRRLNHTYRRIGGGWVHASDLFTTANSARDLARVLAGLRLGRVDLYGDSYGTYFAQSFLSRYPGRVRSVVLDSAYEARDLDPWYRTTVTTAHRAFDLVCDREPACPRGSAWARIGRLAAAVRRRPVRGVAVGTDGRRHRVGVGITALVDLVNDAGYDLDPYRQLEAAARAWLDHRDATPLLRLYLQDIGYDYSDYTADARSYSDGLYLAVACSDYPQLFDMRSTPAQRHVRLAHSIAELPARTFAPFTTREWLTVLPYTETYTGCLDWPAPTHAADPPVPVGASLDAMHVPVLILNGELDSLTPPAGGAHIRRQIGSAARALVAANNVHLVALDSAYSCGPAVVRRFLAAPRGRIDATCLHRLTAVHAVGRYPTHAALAHPASGQGPRSLRRLATVALDAAGDAAVRFAYVDGTRDQGLRGGRIRYDDDGDAVLTDVRFTVDTRVSGRVSAGPAFTARLTISYRRQTFTVTARWGAGLVARVDVAGYRMTAPAP